MKKFAVTEDESMVKSDQCLYMRFIHMQRHVAQNQNNNRTKSETKMYRDVDNRLCHSITREDWAFCHT